MARYRVRAAARSDLAEIRAYIMRDDPGRAVTFIEELVQHFGRLAETPLIGRARPELRPGLRSMVHGRYVIFYTLHPGGVAIVRVLHGARDASRLF